MWGGDGTVRRCIDVAAGSKVPIGILPAGSGNLLAHNLSIEVDLESALDTALHGDTRTLDVGVVNGERFAVMAGAGFGAVMVRYADDRKDRQGRWAYVRGAIRATSASPARATVEVDGRRWFDGHASCILLGNVGTATGGMEVFPEAEADDGLLEVGVVTAHDRWGWAKVFARLLRGNPERSNMVHTTRAKRVDVRLDPPLRWELDGGDRKPTRRLKAHVEPSAIGIKVP